ncbi:hypothetical protein GF337_06165 [candidate division KSB1 bacterium]|nr:hypothetical protein [candidate division KSB1 bacterium]
MGRALLLVTLAFSTLFGTMTLNMSRHSLDSVEDFSAQYNETAARNAATSGVYMALSRIYRDNTWRTGFSNMTVGGSSLQLECQDQSVDPTLSSMELRLLATATHDDITKTISVVLGIPPDLGDLAVFCTDTIINVTIKDEAGVADPSLGIQQAPDMLPFDKPALEAMAVSQGHVINGNFAPTDGYPNNDFYYDAATSTPNVIHVKGDFTINGSVTAYGIYIVEGNATLNGGSRLEGVIYMPNPNSLVIHGGGDPKESSITGGVFSNGSINGTGNHISVRYKSDYMEAFSVYQTKKNMFIVNWRESPVTSF